MAKQNKKVKETIAGPKPLEKDFAHYPPTTAKQVMKKDAGKHVPGNLDERLDTIKADETGAEIENALAKADTKIVNKSNSIVNSENDIYSNGSGGAFEATEQVND